MRGDGAKKPPLDFVPVAQETCEHCGAAGELHKFQGDLLCEDCISQRSAMQ